MGNEASIHQHIQAVEEQDSSVSRKVGRILRSSSLKSQRPDYNSLNRQQRQPKRTEEGTHVKDGNSEEEDVDKMPVAASSIRSKFSLKRSNTFTSFNTFKKPLFPSKLASNDKQTANKMQTINNSKEVRRKATTMAENDVTNNFITDRRDDRIVDTNEQQEKLFIPRNNKKEKHLLEKRVGQSSFLNCEAESKDVSVDVEEMRVARNLRHHEVLSTSSKSKSSSSSRITLKVNKPDEENKSNKVTTKGEDKKKTTTTTEALLLLNTKERTTSSIDSCSIDSKEDKTTCSSANNEETRSNNSSIFEEDFEKNMDDKFSTPDTSEGEEDTRRHSFTPAERRKKNVLRSQSMNYHMTRPRLNAQQHRATSIDDMTDGISIIPHGKGSESPNIGLGSRRRSDTSLLKEQHVRRSEQFTQMLKQYRQQNEKKTQLSSYGLGVIAENSANKQPLAARTSKPRRKNDYIDSWLKDQSDRINNLSAAAKGDADKIRSLRASFRERPLKSPQKDLLPKRPSSMKLPRRNQNNNTAFVSSSDSEDLDIDISQMKLVDTNGNLISSKQQSKNPLKKQLTDTLLLVDKSFKNSTLTIDQGSPSSQRQNNNTTPSKTNGSIRFCSIPTSSVVARASNIAVVKPMKRESSNADNIIQVNNVKRFEDSRPHSVIRCSPSSSSYYKDPLGPQNNDKQLIRQEEHQRRKRVFIRSSSFDNTPQMVSHSTITRTKSDCVDPISQSLNKVMGDLKTLRNQDFSLAKQLLGLGKSIEDYKEAQYISSASEPESLI